MKHHRTAIVLFTAVLLITVLASSQYLGPKWGNAKYTDAYRVLLDGKTWFYIHDQDLVEELLVDYKNEYLSRIGEDVTIKTARIKQNIEIVKVDNYSGKLHT